MRCCSTASPAAARPRSTCAAARATLARGPAGRSCSCPRSALAHQAVARVPRPLRRRGSACSTRTLGRASGCSRSGARARRGRSCVGARSAVFAPLGDLGLIIVDEEHDPAYKQSSCATTGATRRAGARAAPSAVAVLGSATPSLECFAARGAATSSCPSASTAAAACGRDRRPARRTTALLSPPLAEALSAASTRRKAHPLPQPPRLRLVLVLRRAAMPGCARDCDVALTSSRGRSAPLPLLRPHRAAPRRVPEVRQRRSCRHGVGTERARARARACSRARACCASTRTSRRPRAPAGASSAASREPGPDVLLGTQMIAKGLDFPGVTLVGVVNADSRSTCPTSAPPSARSSCSSRSPGAPGAATRPGRVIVQTLDPEARPIALAAAGKEEEFYAGELERRRELGYPPGGLPRRPRPLRHARDKVERGRAVHRRAARRRLGREARAGPRPAVARARPPRLPGGDKDYAKQGNSRALRAWLAANRDRYAARGVRVVPDVDPQWL